MSRVTRTTATECNGLDATNDQPAKTFTKRTTDFIALCTLMVLTDARLFALAWTAGLIGLLVAMGAFQ